MIVVVPTCYDRSGPRTRAQCRFNEAKLFLLREVGTHQERAHKENLGIVQNMGSNIIFLPHGVNPDSLTHIICRASSHGLDQEFLKCGVRPPMRALKVNFGARKTYEKRSICYPVINIYF
jgi:hypothetical protein